MGLFLGLSDIFDDNLLVLLFTLSSDRYISKQGSDLVTVRRYYVRYSITIDVHGSEYRLELFLDVFMLFLDGM